jgi:hypothetical protein
MDSRREETNLTSKFKMQGPNTSKRIMATIGPRKGRNQVLEENQDFISSHTYVETWVSRNCSRSHRLRPVGECSLYIPLQCLKCLYVCNRKYWQWHVPLLVHKRKSRDRWWFMTIQVRDNKDLCMSLLARPTWSEVPSTTLVSFFAVTWLAITP